MKSIVFGGKVLDSLAVPLDGEVAIGERDLLGTAVAELQGKYFGVVYVGNEPLVELWS